MILFRTEATPDIGFGHLTRTVYLALNLKSFSPVQFCINDNQAAKNILKDRGLPFFIRDNFKSISNYSNLKLAIFDLKYFGSSDVDFIKHLKVQKTRTMQITDLGLSQQDVDYTIDASIQKLYPYDEEISLDGPDYSILHHKFRHFYLASRKYRRNIKNIFICLGSALPYRPLRNLVDILYRHHYRLKVAPGFLLRKSLKKSLKRIYPEIRFVGKTDSLARSFYETDLALITPGISAYEAAACGTPGLYFFFSKEQEFMADSWAQKGAGLKMSPVDKIEEEKLVKTIAGINFDQAVSMGISGKKLVDGKGVTRIIDFLKKHRIIGA